MIACGAIDLPNSFDRLRHLSTTSTKKRQQQKWKPIKSGQRTDNNLHTLYAEIVDKTTS